VLPDLQGRAKFQVRVEDGGEQSGLHYQIYEEESHLHRRLMMGDVSMSPKSSCLVMTTNSHRDALEILIGMLEKGSKVLK
jgi:superfamily II RNA helicase